MYKTAIDSLCVKMLIDFRQKILKVMFLSLFCWSPKFALRKTVDCMVLVLIAPALFCFCHRALLHFLD